MYCIHGEFECVFSIPPKHGIIAESLENEVTRLDGTESTVRATVRIASRMRVNREYAVGLCIEVRR